MAGSAPKQLVIKPHATRRLANGYILVGGALLCFALALFVLIGFVSFAWVLALFGGLFVAFGIKLRRGGSSAQLVNRAYREALHGRVAEAEQLLDVAEREVKQQHVLRVVDVQRSLLALRRADLDQAIARADAAVARPLGWWARSNQRVQIGTARALRAIARASRGQRDDAMADIEVVRADDHAFPETIARAELAAAILLEEAGELDALRAHLDEHSYTLLNWTNPRERAIVRAFQRLLLAKRQSVYRKPANDDGSIDANEPPLEDWVAKLAPGAAEFVRPGGNDTATPGPASEPPGPLAAGHAPQAAAIQAAQRRLDALRPPKKKAGFKVVAIWVVLIMLFLAIWTLLAPGEPSPDPGPPMDVVLIASLVGTLFVTVAVGAAFLFGLRANLQSKRFLTARADFARGKHVQAAAELERLCDASPLVAAPARTLLARLALRAGDVATALEHCNQGLASLTKQHRAYAADLALPELLADRAALLALTGATDEAEALLALLADGYTSYPHMARARLRVALMTAARRGDIAQAASAADHVSEISLSERDELLLDLARAAARPGNAGAAELQRLRATLRDDVATRRWLERIAPAFVPAFEQATAAEQQLAKA